MGKMRIKLGVWLLAFWFCFVFFTGTGLYSLWQHQYGLACGLFIPAALGFFMLFYFGHIEMDEDFIRQKTLSGDYAIKWNEITQIEYRQSNYFLVLRGHDKVLTILSPEFGPTGDLELNINFIVSQAAARGIKFVEGGRSFRFPKNTKI